MDEAKFAALAVERLAPAVRTAEQHGWKRDATNDPLLRKQGVIGRMVRLTHPDAPFPVIVFRGTSGRVLCALHRDARRDCLWVEVTRDGALVAPVIDDAPVVADLVERLGVALLPVEIGEPAERAVDAASSAQRERPVQRLTVE
jgi:hypothetical protein